MKEITLDERCSSLRPKNLESQFLMIGKNGTRIKDIKSDEKDKDKIKGTSK